MKVKGLLDRSRMTGDCHVRICERLKVKVLGSTRPSTNQDNLNKCYMVFSAARQGEAKPRSSSPQILSSLPNSNFRV